MSQDNSLLLFSSQGVQDCRVDFGKSFIRRSENSQSFSAFQSIDQSQIADDWDQSLERSGANGNIDNVSKGCFGFFGFNWCGQNNWIDDMNDSIACHNISSHNIWGSSHEIDLNSTFGSFDKINSFTTDSLNGTGSDSSSRYFSSDDMSQDNSLLLFSSQGVQDCRVDFGKSFIRRSENSQSFSAFQSIDQSQIADDWDQSLERSGANGNINNVSKGCFGTNFCGHHFRHGSMGHGWNRLHDMMRVIIVNGPIVSSGPPWFVVGTMR